MYILTIIIDLSTKIVDFFWENLDNSAFGGVRCDYIRSYTIFSVDARFIGRERNQKLIAKDCKPEVENLSKALVMKLVFFYHSASVYGPI